MQRTQFSAGMVVSLLGLVLTAQEWAIRIAVARGPNVVVFLADDQGWGDLSLHGNTNLQTPHIDSIGKEGASFERFYVSPVCSPTRAEFLTGRYHPRCGVRNVTIGGERIDLDESTVAEWFKAAGYRTGAFGKWHNGSQWPYHPKARGFQEYYGFTSGHWGEYFDPPLEDGGKIVRGKGYIADLFTDRAIQFIERHRDEPFFCYLAFNTPHSPYAVPESFWNRFKDKPLAMLADPALKEDLQVTRCVLAMCENLDWNVGRVLKSLEKLGLREDTIVVYFTDNGPATWRWNGGLRGRKGSTDEGGVRSPLLIRWPRRIKPATVIKPMAAAIDLPITLAGLAGVKPLANHPLDGMDFSPLLLGQTDEWPDRMIFSHWAGRLAVRRGPYVLDERGGLYHVLDDPGQKNNLANSMPKLAQELQAAVDRWRREVLAEIELPDTRPFPVGYPELAWTPLPARDGIAEGNIQRSARAPNCSYFVNWTSTEDRIRWDIEVATSGIYEVELWYTCPEDCAGSIVELSFGEHRVQGRVWPAWNPPLYTNQDTLPRPAGESQMKEFRPLKLGKIYLDKGRGWLTLRAVEIPGRYVMDLRLLCLTLVEAASAVTGSAG